MPCGKKKPPYSEAQRRWAFAAEEEGELPKGKAMKWSRRDERREKTASDGMFFANRDKKAAETGNFMKVSQVLPDNKDVMKPPKKNNNHSSMDVRPKEQIPSTPKPPKDIQMPKASAYMGIPKSAADYPGWEDFKRTGKSVWHGAGEGVSKGLRRGGEFAERVGTGALKGIGTGLKKIESASPEAQAAMVGGAGLLTYAGFKRALKKALARRKMPVPAPGAIAKAFKAFRRMRLR